MWMPPPRAWPIVAGTVAFGALALFTEMTAFAFVYIAVAILALMVWVGRSGTWDLRVVVGLVLVLVAAILDHGGTGYAYPGGPRIGMDAQAGMVMTGIVLAIVGWASLVRAAVRPRRRVPRSQA